MSGNKQSAFIISGKEAMELQYRLFDDDEHTTIGPREEQRQVSSCDDSFPMPRDEEPVQLYPRVDPSFDGSENDQYSIEPACTFSSFGSAHTGELVLESACPSIPQIDDCSRREKPSLCRSLAWSQDSLDERHLAKRCRRDEPSPLSPLESYTFSGYHQQHHRHQSNNSLTAIHWEEKIVDSMQLVSFLDISSSAVYSSKASA